MNKEKIDLSTVGINFDEIISQKEFDIQKRDAKKRKQPLFVAGESYATQLGLVEKAMIDLDKGYAVNMERNGRLIQVYCSDSLFGVYKVTKYGRYGKLCGYYHIPWTNSYIKVYEKNKKDLAATEIAREFARRHASGIEEPLSYEEVQEMIRDILDFCGMKTTDINIRNQITSTDYHQLPMDYIAGGFCPMSIAKGVLAAVPLEHLYVDLKKSREKMRIEFWKDESKNKAKAALRREHMATGTATEEEGFCYMQSAGILRAVFGKNFEFGFSGKTSVPKSANITAKFMQLDGNFNESSYSPSYEVDKVIEMDDLNYSVPLELKGTNADYFYLPQIQKAMLGLKAREASLGMLHNIGALVSKDADTFYMYFFRINKKNMARFKHIEPFATIGFTLNKEKANAFTFYSESGKRIYNKTTTPSFFHNMVTKGTPVKKTR